MMNFGGPQDAFLDFTNGKSYARPPGLPDEDGYKLVMSWEEPIEPNEEVDDVQGDHVGL